MTERPLLRASWRWLVVVSYLVPPKALAAYVPHGTELDSFHGDTFVSIVGFLFEDTRIYTGVPVWRARTFEEINLRFYVRRSVGDEVRRAVVFIREVVQSPLIARAARILYNEPYVCCPTNHSIAWNDPGDITQGGEFAYRWNDGLSIGARTTGEAAPLQVGTLEEFILEHYWGYTRQRDGDTKEYRVEHPSWRYWDTENVQVADGVAGFYPPPLCEYLSDPHSAIVAEGSEVAVFPGKRIGIKPDYRL